MPRLAALPAEFINRPFAVREALDAGVTAGRLDAQDLVIPFRGVRVGKAADAETLLDHCTRYAPRMRPWQFFSHETSLVLQGAPAPRLPYRVGIHVSAHRPAREPRIGGVTGHRLQMREDAATVIDGVRVEHVARAWRQAASLWPIDDLVAAADFIVGRGRLATVDELKAEVHAMKGPQAKKLMRVLSDVRPGAASSEETRLRLVLQRAGLPEPELNWELRDEQGHLTAVLDLAYLHWRVDVEYDGRQHAEDAEQYARDVERRAAVRRAGWHEVQITKQHLRGQGLSAVSLVREALLGAGWRGEQ